MVIVNPIPGQESRNSDYLLENGAGVKVNHVCTLTAKINDLLHTGAVGTLRAAAKALGHPHAAFDVARRSLAVIGVAARAGALLRQRAHSTLRQGRRGSLRLHASAHC